MINSNHQASRIKTVFLAGLAALLSTGVVLSDELDETSNAQSQGHNGSNYGHRRGMGLRDPARMVQRLASRLDLDETQEQVIRNITEAAKPEVEALRERARANFTAMRELSTDDPDYSAKLSNLSLENGEIATQGTLLMGRVRAEVTAALTAEQKAELDALIENGRERRGRGRGRGKGARGERGNSDQ